MTGDKAKNAAGISAAIGLSYHQAELQDASGDLRPGWTGIRGIENRRIFAIVINFVHHHNDGAEHKQDHNNSGHIGLRVKNIGDEVRGLILADPMCVVKTH